MSTRPENWGNSPIAFLEKQLRNPGDGGLFADFYDARVEFRVTGERRSRGAGHSFSGERLEFSGERLGRSLALPGNSTIFGQRTFVHACSLSRPPVKCRLTIPGLADVGEQPSTMMLNDGPIE